MAQENITEVEETPKLFLKTPAIDTAELKEYHFPNHGISLEAASLKEAITKLEALIASKFAAFEDYKKDTKIEDKKEDK